jgi:hypothetical protein
MSNRVNPSDLLDRTIETLGYEAADGLVRRADRPEADGRGFVWRELQQKADVNAAYFRGGVPLVAFGEAQDSEGVERLHSRLWNLSRVPILIAVTDIDIRAYSCFTGPSEAGASSDALLASSTPEHVAEVLAEFSRFHVESGRAAAAHQDRFRRAGRVDQRLLENLRDLRSSLNATSEKQRALDALIGRAIFIRYFEDRGILNPEHFQELSQHDSFIDVLRAGQRDTYEFLGQLAERFNGDVFGFDESELRLDLDHELAAVADFFAGTDLRTGQAALWPYDFSIIPPELISSIYEQLLEEHQRADAAYYTPRHIVDLILDEILPWSQTSSEVRVLDPACGSGIFLTEAFRRLVFRAGLAQTDSLTFDELSALLVRSIFGVDLNETALSVAALGLYLALLEELDPPTAWRDARLPPLVGSNLFAGDFFTEHEALQQPYDLILGNPPWRSSLSVPAREYLRSAELSVADQQIAMAFVLRAQTLLAPNGVMGFLLPAKPLLHNRSTTATASRLALFEALQVDSVIDLSALRRDLFTAAVAPGAVLVARLAQSDELADRPDVLHVVPRVSPLQASIDGFVVSQDDVHRVSATLAASAPDVWKVLLWGSLGDFDLLRYLRAHHRSLGEIADERGWVHGQGFQIAGGDENDARHLVGMPFVPTTAVAAFEIDQAAMDTVGARVMHRPRDPRLYRAPHVLVRRGLTSGRPAGALLRQDAAHNNGIFGVAAPDADEGYLELLVGYINSSLGQYVQFLTSSSWGVEREFVEASEHLALPFAEPSRVASKRVRSAVRFAERNVGKRERWQARLDEAVFEAYGLSSSEAARILDLLHIGLDQFEHQAASTAFEPPTAGEVAAYLETLSDSLSEALPSLKVAAAISERADLYTVASVGLTARDGSSKDAAEDQVSTVDSLLQAAELSARDWPSPATIVQPSILVLRGDKAHLVKPSERRYWTVTNAADDASVVLRAVSGPQSARPEPSAP